MTIWEQYEDRHDDYPWRDRNDAVLFDRWWTYRIAAPWIVKTEGMASLPMPSRLCARTFR